MIVEIKNILEMLAQGKDCILLILAIGTGKTVYAFFVLLFIEVFLLKSSHSNLLPSF